MACIYDWKYKHKSPFEAFMYMVDEYLKDKDVGLRELAIEQYKEGYSIQDLKLGNRKVRFMVCENRELLHEDDKPKFLDFK